MIKARAFLLTFLLIFIFSWITTSAIWKKTAAGINCNQPEVFSVTNKVSAKLLLKATEAKTFARQKGFNENTCFLIDMSVSSGKNRFYVYNMEKDSIVNSGLVTHGRCNQIWLEGRKYSNVSGCGCTSLGRYKIGYPYRGTFGLAYKLYGLDKTNSNAFKRYIVLHSHECVPENPVGDDICQSDGCPTVSPGFLKELKPMIENSSKPNLLWILE
jgi:hypothetical protein